MNINSLRPQPPASTLDLKTVNERKARAQTEVRTRNNEQAAESSSKPQNLGTLVSSTVANAAAQKQTPVQNEEASAPIQDKESAELKTSQLVAQLRSQAETGRPSPHLNLDPERVRRLLE